MIGTHKVIRTVCDVLEDVHAEPGTKMKSEHLSQLHGLIQEVEAFFIEHRVLPTHIPDDERI